MKAASVKEIKTALTDLRKEELVAMCLRLSKFKKENKELITFVLFEEHDEDSYTQNLMANIEEDFNCINTTNLYFTKKNIRRIIRSVNKYIRYSGKATIETALLIHVCLQMRKKVIDLEKSQVLKNIFNALLKRIDKSIATMHEDLQFEYRRAKETILI